MAPILQIPVSSDAEHKEGDGGAQSANRGGCGPAAAMFLFRPTTGAV